MVTEIAVREDGLDSLCQLLIKTHFFYRNHMRLLIFLHKGFRSKPLQTVLLLFESCYFIYCFLEYPSGADDTAADLCFHNRSMLSAPQRFHPAHVPQHAGADYGSHLHQRECMPTEPCLHWLLQDQFQSYRPISVGGHLL